LPLTRVSTSFRKGREGWAPSFVADKKGDRLLYVLPFFEMEEVARYLGRVLSREKEYSEGIFPH